MKSLTAKNIGKAVFVAIAKHRHEDGVDGSPVDDVDVARGYWKFSASDLNKAQQCEVLVAVVRSVVVGAWKIKLNAWQKGYSGAIPKRVPSADDVNRYWCKTLGEITAVPKDKLRVDGVNGPGPMCGRSYLFNF